MSISILRRLVAFVCVLSIAGMIVGSVKDNAGAAMTAGIFGAIAILCLIVGNAIDVGSNGGGAHVLVKLAPLAVNVMAALPAMTALGLMLASVGATPMPACLCAVSFKV